MKVARRLALSLAVGAVGGAAFYWLRMPLAWMLGAMVFTTVAAFAGAPLGEWRPLRTLMAVVFGAFLGSAFTPEIVGRIVQWSGGAAAMAAFVVAMTALAFGLFRRFAKLDAVTSYFSATPGGLGEMAIIGEREGGDPRAIPLAHATRILIVVFAIPMWLRFVEGLDVPRVASFAGREEADLANLALLAGFAAAGFLLGQALKLPGGQLIGPMLTCAAAYLTGVVHGAPPALAITVAQVVIGAGVGARFVGQRASGAWRVMLFAAVSGVAMFAGAIAFSALAAPVLGIGRTAMLLALAPGGLAEMALIAISLHVDTAFVSTLHMVRILMIVALAPVVFRLLRLGRPQ